ncbi:MAG TPA: MarR family winged helix-turn-helix transcriptional regulator [Burkholderiales bacterium]|nr:MarR family winged helix-turn-helix transcriptional regulator [Burkholderiales bacterium]
MMKRDFENLADFRYQVRRFLRFSEEASRMLGTTSLQYLLMLHIKAFPRREWATVGELAERLQAKHHGVVSLVSRCEAAGWVCRRTGRGDRRRVEVTLTKKGGRRLADLVSLHRAELPTEGFLDAGSRASRSIARRGICRKRPR